MGSRSATEREQAEAMAQRGQGQPGSGGMGQPGQSGRPQDPRNHGPADPTRTLNLALNPGER